MNFDQYEDPTPEQVELARAARMCLKLVHRERVVRGGVDEAILAFITPMIIEAG